MDPLEKCFLWPFRHKRTRANEQELYFLLSTRNRINSMEFFASRFLFLWFDHVTAVVTKKVFMNFNLKCCLSVLGHNGNGSTVLAWRDEDDDGGGIVIMDSDGQDHERCMMTIKQSHHEPNLLEKMLFKTKAQSKKHIVIQQCVPHVMV